MAGGDRRQEPATSDAVKAAQETAIAKAEGGKPDALISWTDKKSGLEGSIAWDASVKMTYSCRRYRQTITIGSEALSGTLTACPQGDGTWKIVPMPS
jgi:surface antigen